MCIKTRCKILELRIGKEKQGRTDGGKRGRTRERGRAACRIVVNVRYRSRATRADDCVVILRRGPCSRSARVFGYFQTARPFSDANLRAYGGGRILPSVDSLGELVAFQGPPKLTALDISPLHIPRHFHHPTNQRSDVTRGALQERKKSSRNGRTQPRLRGIHTRVRKNSSSLGARDFYQSLLLSFVCGQIRGLTAVYQAADWSIVGHGA